MQTQTAQQKGDQKPVVHEFDDLIGQDVEDPEEDAASARSTDPFDLRGETRGQSHLLATQEKDALPSTAPTPFQRRLSKIPRKTLCTSIAFVTAGIALFIVGIVCFFNCDERKRAFGFMGTGALLLLPGGYSAFILVQYLRGERGYSPNQIPQYD